MDLTEAKAIVESDGWGGICRAHRLTNGLSWPKDCCDVRCPNSSDGDEVPCPEGCAVMDTCPNISHEAVVTFRERELSSWDKVSLDELRQAKAGDTEGVRPELLDDLAMFEEAQRQEKAKPIKPITFTKRTPEAMVANLRQVGRADPVLPAGALGGGAL